MTDHSSNLPFKVAALYRFARLDHYQSLQEPLAKLCCGLGIKGTLLLAAEGVNGTVAGSAAAIQQLVDFLNAEPAIAGMELKYSYASEMPFKRMKVRLKKEIVTMGVADIDPLQSVGTYVEPENWNALIAAPDTILIDTRNDYETAIGTFAGAVDPQTKTFREFPQWVEDHRDELEGKKIAMFCTGGIRCEKATAFVKGLGFEDVYHLKGGILKYLEDVPAEESRWNGECFVFDERVSVGHGLVEGEAELCHACRNPIAPEDKLSQLFEEGVSCPHCYHERTDADRARFAERQKQVRLARARGAKEHIGS
ncbi:rhodanese-related sulfurtransferase [Phyllobacterium sp. UNC302MFCol5.2]|uniref:oxygen-dependent tRNA uridine(34) hydroxylase TrhO n=1 Tax=Phyllobacterium sp. UNC302MFCol5.2 TaxID=1449065 RepID=UPI0004821596|nr:rhodanese-related sulfurtransferase [Phyllobacterium sp. UNC302MFCol5.2]